MHLTHSAPTWTMILSTFLFFLLIAILPETTSNLLQPTFSQNPWTNYQLFSIWHLSHPTLFSRKSRIIIVYTVFSFGCMLISTMFYEGFQQIRLATAIVVIASILSYIISFILGLPLRMRNYWLLQKHTLLKEIKEKTQINQLQKLRYKERLKESWQKQITYFYIFYILEIVVIIGSWGVTLSIINITDMNFETLYEKNRWWAGMMVATFVVTLFVISPLVVLCFGRYAIMRFRGFYYPQSILRRYSGSQLPTSQDKESNISVQKNQIT